MSHHFDSDVPCNEASNEYQQRLAVSFAKTNGYLGARHLLSHEGHHIFAPIDAPDAPRDFIGFPRYIVTTAGEARWCRSFEETRAIMDAISKHRVGSVEP